MPSCSEYAAGPGLQCGAAMPPCCSLPLMLATPAQHSNECRLNHTCSGQQAGSLTSCTLLHHQATMRSASVGLHSDPAEQASPVCGRHWLSASAMLYAPTPGAWCAAVAGPSMLLPGREPPRLKAGELACVDSFVCRGERMSARAEQRIIAGLVPAVIQAHIPMAADCAVTSQEVVLLVSQLSSLTYYAVSRMRGQGTLTSSPAYAPGPGAQPRFTFWLTSRSPLPK
jgi:hypothetical protein